MFYERTKDIDVIFPFIRDVVSDGLVDIVKVATEENFADMLTKTFTSSKFTHFLDLLRVSNI